eukprot:c17714_g1_i1 orf=225-764(-)
MPRHASTQQLVHTMRPHENYPRVTDLKSLLICNDEADHFHTIKALCKGAEDDPPLIFGWENVHDFVAQIANLVAPPAQLPFPLPVPLTVQSFKQSLLNYIKGPNNPSLTVGTTAIPCTQAQAIICSHRAGLLQLDPWFQAVANMGGCTPIAILYVPRPRSTTLDECMSQVPPPAAPLWQ